MKRKIIRDPDVVSLLDKVPEGDPEEYIRAFAWFSNDSVPMLLQPLLESYLRLSEKVLRDKRDVIFLTHIIWCLLSINFKWDTDRSCECGTLDRFFFCHKVCYTFDTGSCSINTICFDVTLCIP
jgi:hypothetical protein